MRGASHGHVVRRRQVDSSRNILRCRRYAQVMSTPPSPAPASTGQAADWLVQVGLAVEEMLWVWDAASGRVLFANQAFERFWGVTGKELGHGRDALIERIHGDDRERMKRARQHVLQSAYSEEYRVAMPQTDKKPARTARIKERRSEERRVGKESRVGRSM